MTRAPRSKIKQPPAMCWREKDVPRGFDKGFTGENGRIYGASTGIGLYLCRKLCGKLGLKISLTSVLGQGTTIEIVFPKGKMMMLS